jgi:hypothetical protein
MDVKPCRQEIVGADVGDRVGADEDDGVGA